MTKEVPLPKDGKKSWEYHTAHTLKAYKDVCFAVYQNDQVYNLVKSDFLQKFGENSLEILEKEMEQDFTLI